MKKKKPLCSPTHLCWGNFLLKNFLVLIFIFGCTLHLLSQTKNVSGTVADDEGTPLSGVSVSTKGSTTTVVSNHEGRFTIQVKEPNAKLIFSYVGFNTLEIAIGNQLQIAVTLIKTSAELNEVIVVGYGTRKKSQLTGAISSIRSRDIKEVVIANTQQALQGRIPGVDVMQQGSKPGAQPRVLVRGRRSLIANNDPLYVMDGFPLSTGIGDINPQDIESIEVLKDASATAIYGARGANGVVLITTRRGKGGKSSVNYDGSYGISNALATIDIMDGAQFAEMKREAARAAGKYTTDAALFEAVELANINANTYTDYPSQLLRTGKMTNQQIGISSSSEKTSIYASLNYFKDEGVVKLTDYNRNVVRLNLDHTVSKWLKIGFSTVVNFSIYNGEGFNPIGGSLGNNPLGKTYNDDGSLNFRPTTDGLKFNPLADLVPGAIFNRKQVIRAFTGMFAEAKLPAGIKYRFNFGPDMRIEKIGNFRGSRTTDRQLGPARAWVDNNFALIYTIENVFHYDKEIGKHKFDVTALQSVQKEQFESNGSNVEGVPFEPQLAYNIGQASIINSPYSNLTQSAILSYMGRVNYNFDDKYLVTATLRADGSSRFGENSKWGYFPGVAVAWNISNEKFMSMSRTIQSLRLRASYGTIGNQAIDPYQTQSRLSRTSYNWDNAAAFGFQPLNSIGNPDLKWESSTTANMGVDFSLFKGRLSGTVEVYRVQTNDLLLNRLLPQSIGFGSFLSNIGSTQNTGLEVSLSTINVDSKKGFNWSTDFTLFANREKILELYKGKVDDIGSAWFIGQPLSVIYDYKKIGIWQTDEAAKASSYGFKPGEIKVADTDGNGKINSDDRVLQGSQIPDFSGGITNRISYKGFDLSVFVYARMGQTMRSDYHTNNNTLFGRYNNLDIDYWTPTNPTNEFPRPNQSQERPTNGSSAAIFDGSFIKVRNINLGYNFSKKIIENLKMQSLRVSVSIQQPFIFSKFISKYKGVDPETAFNPLNAGVNPSVRIISVGISARF